MTQVDSKPMEKEFVYNKNNCNGIDNNMFLEEYNKLVLYIRKNNLIGDIESLYSLVYSKEIDISNWSMLHMTLNKLFENEEQLVQSFHVFMQNPNIKYSNTVVENSRINARLCRIRDLYFLMNTQYNDFLNKPLNLASLATGFEEKSYNINCFINRNDKESFYIQLNFNDIMEFLNQLTQTATQKFEKGNNDIDLFRVQKYLECSEKLTNTLETFKKEVTK